MLTLPDTDEPLREAQSALPGSSTTAPETVRQQITLPTPWLATDDGAHRSTSLSISYRKSARGWSAAIATNLPGNLPATATSTANSIQLDAPVALQPIAIKKPWGQEIWFSGIEQRGESSVRQGDVELPLSHYLALAPKRLTNRAMPILLKILDPKPKASSGNLYFETHDTKQEVYVVTQVDAAAWPDGRGAIRLGMNQMLRKRFPSDEDFRAAYLAAVQSYERIRRRLDRAERNNTNIAAADHDEEKRRRTAMERFTATTPLTPGDVVQVAPGIPHSLQHGVQVFEFQTPTFERNIISFNQEVLTQDHWDSSYAIANMSLAGPQPPALETLSNTGTLCVERIVDFDEFTVLRLTIAANTSWPVDHSGSYAMLAIIAGTATLQTQAGVLELRAEATSTNNQCHVAALLPASSVDARLITGQQPVTALLAIPKPATTGTIPLT